VSVALVAIDGTKMAANASSDANRDFGQIPREILAEAAEIDAREDGVYGEQRGDELPEQLRTREERRRALPGPSGAWPADAAGPSRRRTTTSSR
jgi:hypothetical protein